MDLHNNFSMLILLPILTNLHAVADKQKFKGRGIIFNL
jgi:hypothetical protein